MVNKRQYEVKVQVGAWDFSMTIATLFWFSFFFCYPCGAGTFKLEGDEMAAGFFLVQG